MVQFGHTGVYVGRVWGVGCGGGVYVEGGRVWMGRWVWGAGKYTCRSGYAILCISPRSPLALPQGDGALDQRESAGNKVLINWRAYTDMHRGTQSFITQMVKMVGTEPLEASGGNTTLLPTYRVCEVTSCTPNVPYLSP